MYSPDDRDTVVELHDLPQCSVGAPLPIVLADEHQLLVAYIIEKHDPMWDGTTVRVVGADTVGEHVAIVECVGPTAHMFGPPNDEAFMGHPLAARGLRPYGVYEVMDSSWIRQLESMNSVHPYHRPEIFQDYRHFVLSFHDSTFEVVAGELRLIAVQSGSLGDAARRALERLLRTS